MVEAGVDLLPETAFDTLVLKACLFAIDEVLRRKGVNIPVMASFTIFDGGRRPLHKRSKVFGTQSVTTDC